jgi:hypothetical protein
MVNNKGKIFRTFGDERFSPLLGERGAGMLQKRGKNAAVWSKRYNFLFSNNSRKNTRINKFYFYLLRI